MRLNDSYTIKDIAGCNVLVPRCVDGAVRTVIISGSARWLLEVLRGREFTEESAVEMLMSKYDVDSERACADVRPLFDTLRNCGILDG